MRICRYLALEYVWQEAFHGAIHNFIIAWAGNSTSWKHLEKDLEIASCLVEERYHTDGVLYMDFIKVRNILSFSR